MRNKPALKTNKKKLYYKLINNELVYDNKSIVRYKKNNKNNAPKNKLNQLEELRKRINSIKNCDLKKMPQILFFLMEIPLQK